MRKDDLADVGARRLQRAFAQPFRQVLQKPPHDTKQFLGRSQIVRHLHAHRSRASDGVQEKARRDPGGYSHLARFQHDVAPAAKPGEFTLRAVRLQPQAIPLFIANLEQCGPKEIADRGMRLPVRRPSYRCATAQIVRLPVQPAPQRNQQIQVVSQIGKTSSKDGRRAPHCSFSTTTSIPY